MNDQSRNTTIGSHTQRYARVLRDLLEQLDDLKADRDDLVGRARRIAAADDIQPRIVREAGSFERWIEVKPAMFEETISKELAKYEEFSEDLDTSKIAQEDLLEKIKVCRGSPCCLVHGIDGLRAIASQHRIYPVPQR